MSRSTAPRTLVLLVCALVFVAGGFLVIRGLQEAPPEETPTPDQEFSLSPEEARSIDHDAADRELDLDPDADFGPFVNTGTVTIPSPDDPSAPVNHLYVPSIFVSAPVVAQGVTSSNEMSLPENLHEVGLLDTTSPLEATEGSTLIAGHVTQQGNHGALYFLGRLRPGATVVTTDAAGNQTRWAVTSVQNYRKTSLPSRIFEVTGPRTLTLVTCGGEIIRTEDGRWTHTDNIVMTATPLP